MVKELHCAINGDFPQIRREGDDANIIFLVGGFEYLGVAMEYDFYKNIATVGDNVSI